MKADEPEEEEEYAGCRADPRESEEVEDQVPTDSQSQGEACSPALEDTARFQPSISHKHQLYHEHGEAHGDTAHGTPGGDPLISGAQPKLQEGSSCEFYSAGEDTFVSQ